jgi:hypothetical protein
VFLKRYSVERIFFSYLVPSKHQLLLRKANIQKSDISRNLEKSTRKEILGCEKRIHPRKRGLLVGLKYVSKYDEMALI